MDTSGWFLKTRFYRTLYNSFYYGWFEWPKGSGNWYKGKHKPMITRDEYNRVQELLHPGSKPKPEKHIFAYTGMIRCGECGCMVTAENRIKRNKNGNEHYYTYYHCTKRQGRCGQKHIEIKELEKQIVKTLANIEVPPEFHDWALAWLRAENTKESSDRNAIISNLQNNYEKCVKKLDTLIDMRASGEITEEEFTKKKSVIGQEKTKLQELLNDTDSPVDSWLEAAHRVIKFSEDAKEAFENKGLQAKKIILSALGSNLLLKNKNLAIDVQNALLPMQIISSRAKTKTGKFEPVKTGIDKQKSGALGSANPVWLPG